MIWDEETGLLCAPDGGRDNMPVHTVRYLRELNDQKVRDNLLNYWSRTEIFEGLYTVDFHRLQGMTKDNLTAYCSWPTLDPSAPLKYARRSGWTFNVLRPYKFGIQNGVWYSIGFPQLMKISAGERISLFGDLLLFIGVISTALSGYQNTSSKCLQDDWNQVLSPDRLSVRLWKWIMMKKYPGGRKQLYSIYYGPDFFLTQNARTDFE